MCGIVGVGLLAFSPLPIYSLRLANKDGSTTPLLIKACRTFEFANTCRPGWANAILALPLLQELLLLTPDAFLH